MTVARSKKITTAQLRRMVPPKVITDWRKVEVPERLKGRPRDQRGFIIPYSIDDGTTAPDFRITQLERVRDLVTTRGCWLCGMKPTRLMCFIGGPLSLRNHLFTDGWQHEWCGAYALQVCPFLARPTAKYRDVDADTLPEDSEFIISDYVHTDRPPEFGLAYTRSFNTLLTPEGGLLLRAGRYTKILWYSCFGQLLRISNGDFFTEKHEGPYARKHEPPGASTKRTRRFKERLLAARAEAKRLQLEAKGQAPPAAS